MSEFTVEEVAAEIEALCFEMSDFLKEKNAGYGNSVFDPVAVFSTATAVDRIKVRIDDKLSRIKRGKGPDDLTSEDTKKDLAGYLILWAVFDRLEARKAAMEDEEVRKAESVVAAKKKRLGEPEKPCAKLPGKRSVSWRGRGRSPSSRSRKPSAW